MQVNKVLNRGDKIEKTRKKTIRGLSVTKKLVARTNFVDLNIRVGPGELLAITNALVNWNSPTALEILRLIETS